MKRKHTPEAGFTIVELLIATVVFSMVLLLCATAVVQIGRQFYKGTIMNRTQSTAKTLVDDISQAVQFGATSNALHNPAAPAVINALCIGETRYTYNSAASVGNPATPGQATHVIWKDRVPKGTCPLLTAAQMNNTTPSPGGQELLGTAMRIPRLDVTNSGRAFDIKVTVGYGEDSGSGDNVFTDNTHTVCRTLATGGQFCAVSIINTSAVQRLE